MNEDQISHFRFGYDECARVILFELREILKLKSGHCAAIKKLLTNWEKNMADQHWKDVQNEFPGITREEYDADLENTAQTIRKEYYSKHGYLKPRLVRNKPKK